MFQKSNLDQRDASGTVSAFGCDRTAKPSNFATGEPDPVKRALCLDSEMSIAAVTRTFDATGRTPAVTPLMPRV